MISTPNCTKCVNAWYAQLRHTVSNLLKSDPISAYLELKRLHREEKIKQERTPDSRCAKCEQHYIDILSKVISKIEKTAAVDKAVELMKKDDTNILMVIDNNLTVGVFTIKDYLKGLFKYEKNLAKNTVGSLMSSHIVKLPPDMDIFEANELSEKKGYKNYPVGFDKTIHGVVSRTRIPGRRSVR